MGCTASPQLALAWVLAQRTGELAALDAIAPMGAAAGTRYPEAGMKIVNA